MPQLTSDILSKINSFPKLVAVLRDYLDWPIREDMELDEVVYDWDAAELGLKPDEIVKIREIKQLRPLVTNQPWGVFFISFEAKSLSVTVLRRLLRSLVVKKRAAAGAAERQAWDKNDLMFAANFGASGQRELAFIHFSDEGKTNDLPLMKVLGWNARDTVLHNAHAAQLLGSKLRWPDNPKDNSTWRKNWSAAFEVTYNQVIDDSKKLAVALAGLAQNIRARANELLRAETEQGSMRKMLAAFRKNLIQDLDEDGFADMFAQTIAYGLLAAHISRPSGGLVADNLVDMVPRTNPFLRELFSTFLSLGGRDRRKKMDFDELGVRDVADMLAHANMEAVLRDFGDRNPKEDPVIHFYELFLKQYDPKKRMQRGVFYTPRPVVNFIVRGVDDILRTEFDLPLGLADTTTWGELAQRNDKVTIPAHVKPDQPFVQILDPATGTGTFLVEVIDHIHKTMLAHWKAQGLKEAQIKNEWNAYVPQHLLPRLTGFELMMAPYAIAHMKLGLKLSETGYTFGSNERARIFLTNALEPPKQIDLLMFASLEALAHEAQAANKAKMETPFTVVIGNPPYAGHSKNNNIPEIVKLVHDYKKEWPELLKPGQGKWLQDDYVKFIRFAQSKLDRSDFGVLGFITNHSYFDNPTFKGMRAKLKNSFGQIRILNLHGNVKKKEQSPDGSADEGVFDEVGQGVAIIEAIRLPGFDLSTQLWRDDLLGTVTRKLDYLISQDNYIVGSRKFNLVPPEYFFYPVNASLKSEWNAFCSVSRVMGENGDPAIGIVTTHDEFAVSMSAAEQVEKVRWLLTTPNEKIARERFQLCTQDQWNYAKAKSHLSKVDWRSSVVPTAYRPFDERFTVYNNHVAVHLRDRVMSHMLHGGNMGLSTVRQLAKTPWEHVFVCPGIQDDCYVSNRTKERGYLFPLWLRPSTGEVHRRPNFDRNFAQGFGRAVSLTYDDGIPRGEQQSFGSDYRKQKPHQVSLLDSTWDGRGNLSKEFGPRDLFDWIYVVLHAPSYRARYAEFLKSDFPHIPTPGSRDLFQRLVKLGAELVALHLLRPDEASVLKKPEIVLAGKGVTRVAKGYPEYVNGRVMISETRWFEDVPAATWNFHVGGYQVCQKWLKDRAEKGGKKPTPGRVLAEDDILHYRRVVVALTETRRIMAEIDKVIEAHGGWPAAFGGANGEAA